MFNVSYKSPNRTNQPCPKLKKWKKTSLQISDCRTIVDAIPLPCEAGRESCEEGSFPENSKFVGHAIF
jgi:hypothetical protein